jgi:hypothetical protein
VNPVAGRRGRPAGIGDPGYSRGQRIDREDSDLSPRAGIPLERDAPGTTLPAVNPAAPVCRAWRPRRNFTLKLRNPFNQAILRTAVVKRGAGE